VPVATGLSARLIGLAFLDPEAAGEGLLIPRCSSVHTFGMRFPLDVVFLDRRDSPLSARRCVPRCRLLGDRRAASVLEIPSRPGGEFSPPGT
jgi:uncharacterized membrane protein (UPF0127 family)